MWSPAFERRVEGLCLRIYSTIAAKSVTASGDQRTIIKA